MLLTEGWVNAVAIAIVGLSIVRVWRGTRRTKERRVGEPEPMSFVDAYLLLQHTRENRGEIERSVTCGCVWCEQVYPATEVAGWVGETAMCPRCGRTTVVGSAAGIALTRELLHRSHVVEWGEGTRAG